MEILRGIFHRPANYIKVHRVSETRMGAVDISEVNDALNEIGINNISASELLSIGNNYGARVTVLLQLSRHKIDGQGTDYQIKIPEILQFLTGSKDIIISETGLGQWEKYSQEFLQKRA